MTAELATQIVARVPIRPGAARSTYRLGDRKRRFVQPALTSATTMHLRDGRLFNSTRLRKEASSNFECARVAESRGGLAPALYLGFQRFDALGSRGQVSSDVGSLEMLGGCITGSSRPTWRSHRGQRSVRSAAR